MMTQTIRISIGALTVLGAIALGATRAQAQPNTLQIVTHASDLSDQVLEIRLDDERVGPDSILELRLGKRARGRLNQHLEQLVRLGGKVHRRLAAAQPLPRTGIQREIAKAIGPCPRYGCEGE